MLTGSSLKSIRASRGLSQAELAARAGVSPTAIAEYETDKRELRTDSLRKLCAALNVRIDVIDLDAPAREQRVLVRTSPPSDEVVQRVFVSTPCQAK